MRRWSEEDEKRLKELYGTMTASELAQVFGRTERALYVKCHHLGLHKEQPCKIRLDERRTLWLKLNFPHMSNAVCAALLDISPRSVVRLARRLGLKKTAQFMSEAQAHTARRAKESHLKNGTYPAKGWYSPNLQKGREYQFGSRK